MPIHFSNTTYSTTSGVKSYEVAGTPAIGMFLPLDKEAMFDNDAGRLSGIYDDTYLFTTFWNRVEGVFRTLQKREITASLIFPMKEEFKNSTELTNMCHIHTCLLQETKWRGTNS